MVEHNLSVVASLSDVITVPARSEALLAVTFAGLFLCYRIVDSPIGQVLKAIRENEARAVSLGYRVDRYKLAAFVLSVTHAGLAGATKAIVFQVASLTDVHWTMSGGVVLMTLIGGMCGFRACCRRRGDRLHAERLRDLRRLGHHHPGHYLRRMRHALSRRYLGSRRKAYATGPLALAAAGRPSETGSDGTCTQPSTRRGGVMSDPARR
mgnify:CR=1 FL=1